MSTIKQIKEYAKNLIESKKREIKRLTEERDKVANTNFAYAMQLNTNLNNAQMELSGMNNINFSNMFHLDNNRLRDASVTIVFLYYFFTNIY